MGFCPIKTEANGHQEDFAIIAPILLYLGQRDAGSILIFIENTAKKIIPKDRKKGVKREDVYLAPFPLTRKWTPGTLNAFVAGRKHHAAYH